ncbi:MAG: DUF1566 domain-containing protein [Deltaproteobacteria bacterium]|nr:DUF1566 domain-containing protein [Deltaproteobacteria bacterium]
MFKKLTLSDATIAQIDWEMTPDLAFCAFSAKGLRDEIVNTAEKICYFYIDNWGKKPKLYLMERGIRHVNILAEIRAPQTMITDCVVSQGVDPSNRNNYPINSALKKWLRVEVVEKEDSPFLVPAEEQDELEEDQDAALPSIEKSNYLGSKLLLPDKQCTLQDEQVHQLIAQWNFFDAMVNPQGGFDNTLADSGDGLTVIDQKTDLMWQRSGLDLCSYQSMKRKIEQLNRNGFAGYHDWRMPSIEEAMSLLETAPNIKGVYLHSCFSKEQSFIFVAARRKPTGYWFVDFKQGKIYWSSGTVPGGYSRLCRCLSQQ